MLRTLLIILVLVSSFGVSSSNSAELKHGPHSKVLLKFKKTKSSWVHVSHFIGEDVDAGLFGEGIYGGENIGSFYETELKMPPDGTLVMEFVEMQDIQKKLDQTNFVCRTAISFKVKNEGTYVLEYEACDVRVKDKKGNEQILSRIPNHFKGSRYYGKLP